MKITMKMPVYEEKRSKYAHPDYYNSFSDDNYYKPALTKNSRNRKCYESKVDKDKNSSVKQHFLMILLHLPALINDHKNESNE